MPLQYRPRIPNATWETHKETIERLYIGEDKPLTAPGGVRDTMAREYNFHATSSQFEWRVKRIWKLCKYNKCGFRPQQANLQGIVPDSTSSSMNQLVPVVDHDQTTSGAALHEHSQQLRASINASKIHPAIATTSHLTAQAPIPVAPYAPFRTIVTPPMVPATEMLSHHQIFGLDTDGVDLNFDIGSDLNFNGSLSLSYRGAVNRTLNVSDMQPNQLPIPNHADEFGVLPGYPYMTSFFDFELSDPESMEIETRGLDGASLATRTNPWNEFPDLTKSMMTIIEQIKPVLSNFLGRVCVLPIYIQEINASSSHHPDSMRLLSTQNIDFQVYHFILHRLINDPEVTRVLHDPKTAADELLKAGLEFLLESHVQHLDQIIDSIPNHFKEALEQALFFTSVELGAAKGVAALLSRGIDPDRPYDFSYHRRYPVERYPVQRTCARGYIQATQILLDHLHGANPNRREAEHLLFDLFRQRQPVWEASVSDSINLDMLRLLINRGAMLQPQDAEFVFSRCTTMERKFLVEELRDSICDMILDNTRLLGIILTPGQGLQQDLSPILFPRMKERCLQLGHLRQHNSLWFTFMKNAAACARSEIFASLLQGGTVPDMECFIYAARNKDMPTLRLLLDRGLDPNEMSNLYILTDTALASCIAGGFSEGVAIMLNQGHLSRALERKISFRAVLIAACESGDIDILRYLLQDANPPWLTTFGAMAIETATKASHHVIVEELISAGIKPGDEALLVAIRCRNTALIALLSSNMVTNASGELYSTIFVEAILYGFDPLIRDLIRDARHASGLIVVDSNVDRETNVTKALRQISDLTIRFWRARRKVSLTPLSAAILAGRKEITDYLIADHAQVKCSEWSGRTNINMFVNDSYPVPFISPLTASIYNDDLKQVQALLDRGADPKDDIALLMATDLGDTRCLETLLAADSWKNRKRHSTVGARALLKSMRTENLESFELLMDIIDPYENISEICGSDEPELNLFCPLGVAIDAHSKANSKSEGLLLMIMSQVRDMNSIVMEHEVEAMTPLLRAINLRSLNTVRILVESGGADVSLLPRFGCKRTPLQAAAQYGSVEIVNYLLQCGAQVNETIATHAGATSLQAAAFGGFIQIAATLLDRGADINAVGATYDGRTAFEGATEHGRIEMMTFLFEHGADLLANNHGQLQRAVCYAHQNAQYAAIEHAERLLQLAQRRAGEQ